MNRSWKEHVGVGRPHYGVGRRTGGTRTLPVVADDGARRGSQVGTRTEHADGRVDAVATAEPIRARALTVKE